jgi:hypothetical protein
MYKEKVVGTTKGGKTIAYRVHDGDALYSIYFPEGGETPDCLKGAWNDPRLIEIAITSYLNRNTLCEPMQAKKDFRKNIADAKKRPSRLKLKEAV